MENINPTGTAENNFGVKFIDPEAVVEQLDIKAGMKVADFGSGTGYFSLALAKKIGEEGVVYAFDILPQRLEAVASNAKNANLTNIITKRANLEKLNGSGLADGSVDMVVLKDMLFQNKRKKDILIEAFRILKNGGNALVVEWGMTNDAIGPDRQLRISKEALQDIVQQAGLSTVREIGAGNFHYGILLVK